MVVGQVLEAWATYPGLHGSAHGVQGDQSTRHQGLRVFDGIQGAEVFALVAFLGVGKNHHGLLHLQGLLNFFFRRAVGLQTLVQRRLFDFALEEVGQFFPGRFSPMGIEVALNALHLPPNRLVGKALQGRGERGFNDQAVPVHVVFGAVGFSQGAQDFFHFRTDGCQEIRGRFFIFQVVVIDLQWLGAQLGVLLLCQVGIFQHLPQDHISAFAGIFRVLAGIVLGIGFQQPHQYSRFLQVQVGRLFVEIPQARRFNSVHVFAKTDGV